MEWVLTVFCVGVRKQVVKRFMAFEMMALCNTVYLFDLPWKQHVPLFCRRLRTAKMEEMSQGFLLLILIYFLLIDLRREFWFASWSFLYPHSSLSEFIFAVKNGQFSRKVSTTQAFPYLSGILVPKRFRLKAVISHISITLIFLKIGQTQLEM